MQPKSNVPGLAFCLTFPPAHFAEKNRTTGHRSFRAKCDKIVILCSTRVPRLLFPVPDPVVDLGRKLGVSFWAPLPEYCWAGACRKFPRIMPGRLKSTKPSDRDQAGTLVPGNMLALWGARHHPSAAVDSDLFWERRK